MQDEGVKMRHTFSDKYWSQIITHQNEFRISVVRHNPAPLVNVYKDGKEYLIDKEEWFMEKVDSMSENSGENWIRSWKRIAAFKTYREAENFIEKERKFQE